MRIFEAESHPFNQPTLNTILSSARMRNLNKLNFPPLGTKGMGYHKCVHDVRLHLKAQGILAMIQEPSTDVLTKVATNALDANKAKAIIIMDESLQFEYLNKEDLRRLWVSLEECFGNVRNSLLLDLEMRWHNLRFCDFKHVLDYNSEAFHIKSLMEFSGKDITNTMLIERISPPFSSLQC
ncbi:uncharacterized protein LOC112177797 [Rosa chinensis]|uniref:uncharacterized protein LOC112177797 n=1 Tax=Rosa chinensis TaxID=74649 RepID=UPI000D093B89|nr:uncharacterized protein LOC112177797 [Rosa chinensis]